MNIDNQTEELLEGLVRQIEEILAEDYDYRILISVKSKEVVDEDSGDVIEYGEDLYGIEESNNWDASWC